jgi:hypothetical protein
MNGLDKEDRILLPLDIYGQMEDVMFTAIKQVAAIVDTHHGGSPLPPDVLSSFAGMVAPSVTQVTFLLLAYIRTHIKAQTPIEVIHASAELTTALANVATSLTHNMNRAKEFAKQTNESH